MERMTLSTLSRLPAVNKAEIDWALEREIQASSAKIVVLDDDPTGTQTVHDISVYTDWSQESIQSGFGEQEKLFYILTNSRSMTQEETRRVHREIAERTVYAAQGQNCPFLLISRCDSTLRGHYPLETAVLRETLEEHGYRVDGEILCPFFQAGGRYTIGNIHYARQGEELVPVAETEFARDKTFGYHSSSLPEYIQEKTKGAYTAEDVVCVSLDQLRACDYDGIQRQLMDVRDFGKVIVNAVDAYDIKVFCVALYRAVRKGKYFLFRTAAEMVKAIGGVKERPLLTREELLGTVGGCGVVVVGSHTQKTSRQLEKLLELESVQPVPFRSSLVLRGEQAFDEEVRRCIREEEALLRAGKTAVCYTERKLLSLPDDSEERALIRSVKISEGVQRLVGELGVPPKFVVSKGGITSSDVAVRALNIKKARVMGQIQPGIPVWKTGPDSRFPGIPFIIFPGNTGDEDTLRRVAEILLGVPKIQ